MAGRGLLGICLASLFCSGLAFQGYEGPKKGSGCIFAEFGRRNSFAGTGGSKSRALLQSQCSLQLSGTSYTFTACHDYSASLGQSMTVHYSVVNGGSGGNLTFRGGIEAAHQAGVSDYIGFGFQPELEMIGGNAFITQTCTSCASGASIDDYYLSQEDVSGVNKPSKMAVAFKSAALSNGRFIAVFEVQLTPEQASLTNAGIIFAAGPKSSSGDFQTHGFYNGENLDLSSAVTTDLGTALSPLSDVAAAPAPTTVSPVAQVPAAAPRLALPACSIQYSGNNSVITFQHCQDMTTASTVASNLKLFWQLRSEPSGNGTEMVAALETTATGQWAGFAFPSQPGQMVGAQSIIVHPCTQCATGAQADRYYLAGTDSSQIIAGTGNLVLGSVEAYQRGGGGVQALFNLKFNQTLSDLNVEKSVIAAVGPSTGGRLGSHPTSNAFTGVVNFASGTTTGGTATDVTDSKVTAHALLMIIGWGLVLPFGVVFARCKEWGQIWFQLHRAFQVAGYVAGAAGAGLGWSFGRPNRTDLEQNHRIVGWTVWLLLTIQMCSLFWRPKPTNSKLRKSWTGGHIAAGSASVFLAFANVFIGLKVSGEKTLWSGLYALAFGLIVLLWISKAGYNATVLKKRGVRSHSRPLKNQPTPPSSSNSDDVEAAGAKK